MVWLMNLRSIEPKFFKTSNQLIQGRMLDNGRENAFRETIVMRWMKLSRIERRRL